MVTIQELTQDMPIVIQYFTNNCGMVTDLSIPGTKKWAVAERYDTIFEALLDKESLYEMPGIGKKFVERLEECFRQYVQEHEEDLQGILNGDRARLMSQNEIRRVILLQFEKRPFEALDEKAIESELLSAFSIDRKTLKESCSTSLSYLVQNEFLVRRNGKYKRQYMSFCDFIQTEKLIRKKDREVIHDFMELGSCKAVSIRTGVSRQAVHCSLQYAKKHVRQVYRQKYFTYLFSEDYYKYFFEHYQCHAHEQRLLQLSDCVLKYFALFGIKCGTRDLNDCVNDERVPEELRDRVINQNKIRFSDGEIVKKKRRDLEEKFIKQYAVEYMYTQDVEAKYKQFLESNGLDAESYAYKGEHLPWQRITSHKNIIWTRGNRFRYYDMDQDFTPLLTGLELDKYQDIRLSAKVFFDAHRELMKQYHIRSPYELHSLLRRLIPEDNPYQLTFHRMPTLEFGSPNWDAVAEGILEDAPSMPLKEFASKLSDTLGYSKPVIYANILCHFDGMRDETVILNKHHAYEF